MSYVSIVPIGVRVYVFLYKVPHIKQLIRGHPLFDFQWVVCCVVHYCSNGGQRLRCVVGNWRVSGSVW